jgi:NADH-quinone oxidoreductase subunit G
VEDQVTLTVDGQQMQVPKGTLLWEACKSHDIDIPIFCYHTKLGAVGACRTCLVEVEGQAKGPITACSTPVADGMVVRTRSPIVEKAQRGVLEFLLLNHPLDCPICDRAGECPLQDQTFSYGPGTSRYVEPKRHHVKPIALGPTIALDRERCVLCWRCVRFCSEIAEDKSIILLDRGDHSMVGTFQEKPYISNFSGNVIELCPVGALTGRKQRFNFRPWELKNRPSICPHCAMGCNINVSVRKNDEVIRFLSRDNPDVDDSWLCDRGRFNFEFINSPERLRAPLIRRGEGFEETSWSGALEFIAGRLSEIVEESGAESVAGIASPRLANEDLFVFNRFMRDVVGSDAVDHFPRPLLDLDATQRAAWRVLDDALTSISSLKDARTIILLAADPSEREPVMELRIRQAINKFSAKLVVINPAQVTLSSKASHAVSYPPQRLADVCRALAASLGATFAVTPSTSVLDAATQSAIGDLADMEGPFVVVYDDAFDGVVDKGDAVAAIASLVGALRARGTVGVLPLLDDCNSMGARDLGVGPGSASSVDWGRSVVDELASPDSPIRAAFLLGANLVEDAATPDVAAALARLDLLVVHELFLTDTARLADVILPAASFAEKTGTFTNSERRVQAIAETVPAPGIARADWEILVDLSQYMERQLDFTLPQEVFNRIAIEVPAYGGLSLEQLGATGARPRALQAV